MDRRFDRDSKYNSMGPSRVSEDAFEFMDTHSSNKCEGWSCGPEKKTAAPEKKSGTTAKTKTAATKTSGTAAKKSGTTAKTGAAHHVVPHEIDILEIDVYDGNIPDDVASASCEATKKMTW